MGKDIVTKRFQRLIKLKIDREGRRQEDLIAELTRANGRAPVDGWKNQSSVSAHYRGAYDSVKVELLHLAVLAWDVDPEYFLGDYEGEQEYTSFLRSERKAPESTQVAELKRKCDELIEMVRTLTAGKPPPKKAETGGRERRRPGAR